MCQKKKKKVVENKNKKKTMCNKISDIFIIFLCSKIQKQRQKQQHNEDPNNIIYNINFESNLTLVHNSYIS